jgi:hypothetical protein
MVVQDKPWTPLVPAQGDKAHWAGAAIFLNSRYQVAVYPVEHPPNGMPPFVHVSLKRLDNIAITDFRDVQRIKSELIGPESYAFQVFPPESELVDTANQYHIYCLVPYTEDGEWPTLPYMMRDGRYVCQEPPPGGRQRSFTEDMAPDDLEKDVIPLYARAFRKIPKDQRIQAAETAKSGNPEQDKQVDRALAMSFEGEE